MNHCSQVLAAVCRSHLLTEKLLLAPSLRVGHQWLEAVARSGQGVVNARVQTVAGVALELAGAEMAARGVRTIDGQGAALVVEGIVARIEEEDGAGRVGPLGPTVSGKERRKGVGRPGKAGRRYFSRRMAPGAVLAAVEAMRLAGVEPEMVRPGAFEVAAKGRDIGWVLREYLAALEALACVDYAGVLRMAGRRLEEEPAALGQDVLVLLPEDLELAALEREMIEALPKDRVRVIAVDRPGAAPEAMEIFRAVGEVNEVREVFRRCLEAGVALDEVEVLHTDAETYVPLFYELGRRIEPNGADAELPITFAEGIPVRYSRPGRALTAWLSWAADDFPQATLARMIQDGLLNFPTFDREGCPETGTGTRHLVADGRSTSKVREPVPVSGQPLSFSKLAGTLRSVGIGLGRERYLPRLAAEIEECRRQAEGPATAADEESQAEARASARRRLERLELLNGLVIGLLGITPPGLLDREGAVSSPPRQDRGSPRADIVLSAAERFLDAFARRTTELDNYAAQALLESIRTMQGWAEAVWGKESGPAGQKSAPRGLGEWLAGLAEQVRVGGSGPRPGCLHVAGVAAGGHSGRPVTFIVGLDDGRFPGAGLQDPVLLDHERQVLSPALPTAAGRLKEKLDRFARLLARLRGRIVLSYCCHDLADDREMFPSPVVLSAFRALSGKRDGDQTDLLNWLPPPASFAPPSAERSLDEAEWWLWRLCGETPVSDVAGVVGERFPHLARGRRAEDERAGERFTCYDGMVPEAGKACDPTAPGGPVLSASGLERLGRCPLAWFFYGVLGLRPPDELAIDPDVWLDPLATGSLLHEVFREFMADVRGRGMLPKAGRDRARLAAILERHIAQWREACPPPNESVFRAECRVLRETARIFLTGEEEHCRESTPEYLEASLGMEAEGEGSPLDDPQPITIALPDGRKLRARGRIDRVDRLGGESGLEFAVWDYKTGSPAKYRGDDPFAQGRLVQLGLYLRLVEAALARKVGRKAVVRQAGYIFPTARGEGVRIVRTREQLAETGEVLQRLCGIVANGAFLATSDAKDCGYCEYQLICQDTEATAAASQCKLANGRNHALRPMRELRSDG